MTDTNDGTTTTFARKERRHRWRPDLATLVALLVGLMAGLWRPDEPLPPAVQPLPPDPVIDYVRYLDDPPAVTVGDTTDPVALDVHYVAGAVLRLSEALATPPPAEAADVERLRGLGELLQAAPADARRADSTRAALHLAATMVEQRQRQVAPELADEAAELVRSTEEVTRLLPVIEQRERIHAILDQTGILLAAMHPSNRGLSRR